MWVMPLRQGTTDRPHQPRTSGDRRPLVASRGPNPADRWLGLDLQPPEGSVFCAPCENWSSSVGFTGPLLCWLAVLCRHEPPRDLHQPCQVPSQARVGGDGCRSSQVRRGSLYGDRLRLVGSKLGERHRACAHLQRGGREIHFQGPPGNTGPGSLPPQGLHVCLCVPGGSCLQVLWGHRIAIKATPVSWQQLGLRPHPSHCLLLRRGARGGAPGEAAWGSVQPSLFCSPTPPQGHLGMNQLSESPSTISAPPSSPHPVLYPVLRVCTRVHNSTRHRSQSGRNPNTHQPQNRNPKQGPSARLGSTSQHRTE